MFVNRSVSTNLTAGCQWWKEYRAAAKQKFNKFAAIFYRIGSDFFSLYNAAPYFLCVLATKRERTVSETENKELGCKKKKT